MCHLQVNSVRHWIKKVKINYLIIKEIGHHSRIAFLGKFWKDRVLLWPYHEDITSRSDGDVFEQRNSMSITA